MVPSVRSKWLVTEIWLMLILMKPILTMILMMIMIMMMMLMMIMMTRPYDYDDDTDDNNDHKNDSYTAASATPGASVPCSLFLVWRTKSRVFGMLIFLYSNFCYLVKKNVFS